MIPHGTMKASLLTARRWLAFILEDSLPLIKVASDDVVRGKSSASSNEKDISQFASATEISTCGKNKRLYSHVPRVLRNKEGFKK